MRVGLLVNPSSGRGNGGLWQHRLGDVLTGKGFQVQDLTSPSVHESRDKARAAVADGVDALVVAGGDGMVHLGVNATVGTGVPLGIVPVGSGNDAAAALGLPNDPLAAVNLVAAQLRAGQAYEVDCARVRCADGSEHHFLCVLSVGFDAVVSMRAERLRWPRGPQRYTVATAVELPFFRPRRYRLSIDDRPPRQLRAMLVAAANTSLFGGGMQIVPHAKITDGLLDLMLLRPLPIPEFVQFFPRVFKGRHVTHPKVEFVTARRLHVEVDPPLVAFADGEPLGPTPVTCEVAPSAVRLLLAAAPC